MEHSELLNTLAEVATAFAGFTGIVVVLGHRSLQQWRLTDKAGVWLLLSSSLGVVLFAFVPRLAAAAHLSNPTAWRVSILLFGTYHLILLLWGLRMRRATLDEPPPVPVFWGWTMFAGGFLVVVAQYVAAAGLLEPWLLFLYLFGLLWFLWVATFCFAMLLMRAASPRPAA